MALEFQIATGSSLPIYRQIVGQVCSAVVSGALVEGDRLPSVRALADYLVVNPNTVSRAYGELVRDGLAESQSGRGFFIIKKRVIFSKEERLRRIHDVMAAFLSEAHSLGFTEDEIQKMIGKEFPEVKPKNKKQTSHE